MSFVSTPFEVWESRKLHQDLIDDKELYAKASASMTQGIASTSPFYQVHFNLNDPYNALNAPVTELALWTLKDGTDKTEFANTLNDLFTHANSLDGVYDGGWGEVDEDARKFAVLLGRNSAEVSSIDHYFATVQQFM